MAVERKYVVAVFPGIKEPAILGKLHDIDYDRGIATVSVRPYTVEKSESRLIKGDKVKVTTIYIPDELVEYELPMENVDEREDIVFLYKHPSQDILTFTPEEFGRLKDFERYNELRERCMQLEHSLYTHNKAYKGLVETINFQKKVISEQNAEVAYGKYLQESFSSMVKGMEQELIDVRQKNNVLVGTVESMLASVHDGHKIVGKVADMMNSAGDYVQALRGKLIEFQKQVVGMPDASNFLKFMEEQTKREAKMSEKVEGAYRAVQSAILAMSAQGKTPPKQIMEKPREEEPKVEDLLAQIVEEEEEEPEEDEG